MRVKGDVSCYISDASNAANAAVFLRRCQQSDRGSCGTGSSCSLGASRFIDNCPAPADRRQHDRLIKI